MNKENITEKHIQDMERIKEMRLIDDIFMSKVFEDRACAEVLLRAILKKNDLKVKNVNVQYDIKNLQGRSVRLDILAEDEIGKIYDIEVQRSNTGADAKRARYNISLLDANITEPGDTYKKLAETYVIFITESDVFKAGKAVYHIDRVIRETKKIFEDEAHIIYVNSQKQNNTTLGRIMHDFYCKDAKDVKNKTLKNRIKFFKEDKEGVTIMANTIDKFRLECEIAGMKKQSIETARKMIKAGRFSNAEIADFANLTEVDVESLKEDKNLKIAQN